MGFDQAPALPYRNLGIVEDSDTASQAIEKDKYIIWKGGNYFAKTDILQGETFVVDTNLTEIPDGAINGIVEALSASLDSYTSGNFHAYKYSNFVMIQATDIDITLGSQSTTTVATLPEGFRPNRILRFTCRMGGAWDAFAVVIIDTDGTVKVRNCSSGSARYAQIYCTYIINS